MRFRWNSIYVFFAVYIPSLFLSGVIYTFYLEAVETQTVLRHKVILKALYAGWSSENGVPQHVSELARSESLDESERKDVENVVRYESKKHSLEYYPNAWNKPGKVLLESYLFGRQVVTFGDGSEAVVSRWSTRPEGIEAKHGAGYSSDLFFISTFLVLPPIIFWLIIIGIRLVQKARGSKKRNIEEDGAGA
jgi:hypothetical protein